MAVYVGCSGWFYFHWNERFYPNELPQNKWFKFYTEKFNTVELNSTFYRFPKPSTAKAWVRQSPPNFIYTLKVNRMITHIKKFKNCRTLIKEFYAVGDVLKEKLGCFLFQLPPSLKFSKQKLNEIINQLDLDKKNVIEFRHPTWFTQEVYEKLKDHNIIFCCVSAPGLPEHVIKTADDIYIRFHGKEHWYWYNYTREELSTFARKIKSLKPKNTWAYFNNDSNAYAPWNALDFRKLLEL